ncbi:type I-E CRISPR-associated protein Cas5/CasD [Actinokineospora sp. 24-640]
MTGLLLHLAAPLQSWGTNSAWHHRDTHTHPTRSGITGLLAAATGTPRGDDLSPFDALTYTIRVDRPGHHISDFHTIGGGRTPEHTPILASGKRRPAGKGTILTQRHYLTDAAFTIAITTTKPGLLDQLTTALTRPTYTPYLGRRSCPPPAHLYLGTHPDPVGALHTTIPLARTKPRTPEHTHVDIDFITETPPPQPSRTHTTPTHPEIFGDQRTYRPHTTWTTTHPLPAILCAGHGSHYLHALTTALRPTQPRPENP